MSEHQAKHDVSMLCRLLELSRSGFYAWLKRKPSARAVKDDVLTKRIEAIHELKCFHQEYADARTLWAAGNTDVVFPAGTYWIKHFTSARVQKPPERLRMN